METVEWFASLSYGSIDILIPQSQILESNYSRFTTLALETFSVDDFVTKVMGIECKGESETLLLMKQNHPYELKTTAIPSVQKIEYSTMRVLEGFIGTYLREQGLIAFRNYNGRQQYILDINLLREKYSNL